MHDFFKVTKGKIILAVVVIVLNTSAVFYSAEAVFCTEGCPKPNIFQSLLSPAIAPFSVFILFGEFFEDIIFLPDTVAGIFTFILSGITLIIFWYSISCLLIKINSLIQGK